jgi:hypothetical protein
MMNDSRLAAKGEPKADLVEKLASSGRGFRKRAAKIQHFPATDPATAVQGIAALRRPKMRVSGGLIIGEVAALLFRIAGRRAAGTTWWQPLVVQDTCLGYGETVV